jgi:putative aldouronate transport system permease protein
MDSRLSLILPLVANGFYIIIMRNFLMTIDVAYEESAMIDGAGYPTIATRIVLPLSKAVTATIALWTAVSHWNEWFHAMLFIDSRSKWVLQYILRRMLTDLQMVRRDMVAWDERVELLPTVAVRSAMTVLTIGPIILVYPFLQRFFIKGVFVGSLKG